ncbi:MAG: IS4 family transposase, partial [Desulfosalsimonas sp.]
ARQYGKRWDIEVFFKMCKQHLKLAKEIQIRDFDGLIGHTSMVLARYNILAWFQRQQVDQRSFGDLFRFCNEEMENIKFLDALKRILQMAIETMRGAKAVPEKILGCMMNAVMGAAIIFFGLSENKYVTLSEA